MADNQRCHRVVEDSVVRAPSAAWLGAAVGGLTLDFFNTLDLGLPVRFTRIQRKNGIQIFVNQQKLRRRSS